MKMAKASQSDLDMAMELSNALDALEKRLFPAGMKRDDAELFDDAHPRHCEEALAHLLELYQRASLMRVVWGCAVMLDPRNRLVDPSADTIEHHPDRAELASTAADFEARFNAERRVSEELRRKVEALEKDAARLDMLALRNVTVRRPVRYGSLAEFSGRPIEDDPCDPPRPWDIRAAIDAALAASQKGGA